MSEGRSKSGDRDNLLDGRAEREPNTGRPLFQMLHS